MSSYRHLVALGSSFAAGPGVDPIIDSAANRSGANYAHLLAGRLGAQLTDLTVSGATTTTILDRPQRTLRKRFPPQVESIPADADLITITAGGNDLGYSGGMIRAALAGWLRSRVVTRPIGKAFGRNAVPAVDDAAVAGAADGLARVVEAARSRAPKARIVLVDYLTVVGNSTRTTGATPLETSEIEAFRRIGGLLTDAFATAAARTSADLVTASALSVEHGLGSQEPWVTSFRPTMSPMPFHPNAAGMRVVADAIHDRVTSDRTG